MMNELKIGIKAKLVDIVTEEKTAAAHGSGLLPVYATPFMIGLMERTCSESVQEYLPEGYSSVGIHVDIRHVASTGVGMKVWCESELLEINGKRLKFAVRAYNEKGVIGEGFHERAIINSEKFIQKTMQS